MKSSQREVSTNMNSIYFYKGLGCKCDTISVEKVKLTKIIINVKYSIRNETSKV